MCVNEVAEGSLKDDRESAMFEEGKKTRQALDRRPLTSFTLSNRAHWASLAAIKYEDAVYKTCLDYSQR